MTAPARPDPTLAARVRALEALFERIAATRMAGVLVTPWFMNLVWLPLDDTAPALAVRASRTRAVGHEQFEFLGRGRGFGGWGGFDGSRRFFARFWCRRGCRGRGRDGGSGRGLGCR